jgi:hypothetical protein
LLSRFVGPPPPPARRLIVPAPIQRRLGLQRSPSSHAPVSRSPILSKVEETERGPPLPIQPLVQVQQPSQRRAPIQIPVVVSLKLLPPPRLRTSPSDV